MSETAKKNLEAIGSKLNELPEDVAANSTPPEWRALLKALLPARPTQKQ